MLALTSDLRFHIFNRRVDMRKSFDGLCGIILSQMKGNPANGDVYVFINKERNKVKLLRWESGGFVLYYKRLEAGCLDLSFTDGGQLSEEITYAQLYLMIEGITIRTYTQRKRYKKPTG